MIDFLINSNYNELTLIGKKVVKLSRTGRPRSDNPKETQLGVRLNREELEILNLVAGYYGETRTASFRRGIRKLYEEIKACTKDLD